MIHIHFAYTHTHIYIYIYTRWCFGEGLVDFWVDRWLQDDPFCQLYCRQDSPQFLVAEFFIGDKWNEAKLRLWLLQPIVLQVLQVQFDPSKKDSMVWSPSANGLFSISTAWETVRKRKNISLVSGLIWNAIVPIKLSFFVWRLLHNLLTLEENLQQKRFKSVEGR